MVPHPKEKKHHQSFFHNYSEKARVYIKEFFNAIYLNEKTYNSFVNKIIDGTKVLIAATRKFIHDDCLTKASSISYTTIMSLIPTLAVILTSYSIFYYGAEGKKEEIFNLISNFIKAQGVNINIDPVFAILSSLIDNAGKIGGISAVIMIFTATAMLRSLEKSLNAIFTVKKNRALFLRIIYYWALLTLAPIMLVTGTAVATQISAFFSAPNYNSATFATRDTLWVVGNKAGRYTVDHTRYTVSPLSRNRIDFDNQKTYGYNEDDGAFVEQPEQRVHSIQFEKTEFNDIAFVGNNGWIVGNDGIILRTKDAGKSWTLYKWGTYDLQGIHMLDGKRGFCITARGILLKTSDGGDSWIRQKWEESNMTFNSIAFYNNRGIIAGNSGLLINTFDGGKTWEIEKIKAAERTGRYTNLLNAFLQNENTIYLVGSEGMVLKSVDSGVTWTSKKFREYNYRAIYFFNNNEGIIAGDRGSIITTKNSGITWQRKHLPTYQINTLLFSKSVLWAIGDTGLFMHSRDRGIHWSGSEGRSFISLVINFIAPFFFIWILFLIAYISLPNTRVPFKDAAIGASFTAAVWVIFILLFIYYIKAFARGTFAIYGALASIPLFLLIIYFSSVIILYGAEVSFTLMHPESYKNLKRLFEKKEQISLYYGIAILYQIYEKFERGDGATYFKELMNMVSQMTEVADFYTTHFTEQRLIVRLPDTGFVPNNTSNNVKLADVIESIITVSYAIPKLHKRSHIDHYVRTLFDDLSKKQREATGNITVHDLIAAGRESVHST